MNNILMVNPRCDETKVISHPGIKIIIVKSLTKDDISRELLEGILLSEVILQGGVKIDSEILSLVLSKLRDIKYENSNGISD